jgi:SAM-dependent methyltransferase
MRDGRYLLDEFLFQVKLSDLIPDGGGILEIGTGHCLEHYMMFHDMYNFQPTDHIFYESVPNLVVMDAQDFSTSELIKQQPEWDAILASQILEHVVDERAVLRECYKHLKMNGVLIVTLPFWYRLHESDTPGDNDTDEIDMLDYRRITPSGLKLEFYRAGFERFYVSALYPDEGRRFSPPFVVGWAQKLGKYSNESCVPELVHKWSVELPENWRYQQMMLEAKFNKEIRNGGK